MNGIAITDHDTIKGALEAKNINNDPNFVVIVGCEILTNIGDIIGLFLNKEIKSRDYELVIKEIKDQDGIVVLPHPYRGHELNSKLIENVDIIEVFNSRNNENENRKALKLAEKYNKPIVAGSDAHFSVEIGNATTLMKGSNITEVHSNILNATIINTKYSPSYLKPTSQIIKAIKIKEYNMIPREIFNLISFIR